MDAAGLQPCNQVHRRFEHKRFALSRVLWCDWRFHIHKAEVGASKDVAHLGEQGGPSCCASAGVCRGLLYRSVRNDITRNGKR